MEEYEARLSQPCCVSGWLLRKKLVVEELLKCQSFNWKGLFSYNFIKMKPYNEILTKKIEQCKQLVKLIK